MNINFQTGGAAMLFSGIDVAMRKHAVIILDSAHAHAMTHLTGTQKYWYDALRQNANP